MLIDNNHLVLFPQILGVYKFDKNEELKKEITNQISIYKGTEYEQSNDGQGIVHYFNDFNQNFFDDQRETIDVIEDLRAFIIRKTNLFADEAGFDHRGFSITDSWINVSGKNSYQDAHNHCNSFISGTYYVSYDPEKHPPLQFTNPNNYRTYPTFHLDRLDRKNHVFGEKYECHWLEEGMLVLWQSGMYHGYPMNRNENRISISMNMFPRVLKRGAYGASMN